MLVVHRGVIHIEIRISYITKTVYYKHWFQMEREREIEQVED